MRKEAILVYIYIAGGRFPDFPTNRLVQINSPMHFSVLYFVLLHVVRLPIFTKSHNLLTHSIR